MDEATPHLHLDYIPVAHGYKTGLSTRNSLTKGLQEMGIEPAKGKNDNETMHWQQREREFITGLCRERGLDIEVLGIKRDDYSLPEYKAAMREVEAAEAEIEILNQEKEEIVSVLEESKETSERYDNAITEQLKILDSVDDQIKEAELKREPKLHDVSKILDAGKLVTHEVEEIEKKAVEVKPLFGKEPMVKIPRSIFNKLLERYKVAGTFEKLYQDYYGKSYSLQLTVNSLKERVQELNVKVRQLTSFIEEKGLVAAFKEFLKPKPKSIVEALKVNKAKVNARKEQQPKVIDVKKRQSPVR